MGVKFDCSKHRGVVGDYCDLYINVFEQIQKIIEFQGEADIATSDKLWFGVHQDWCDKIIEEVIKEQRWSGIISEAKMKITQIETKRDEYIQENIDFCIVD